MMEWTGTYPGFVGYRITVVQRVGTTLTAVDLDISDDELPMVAKDLLRVLPVANDRVVCIAKSGDSSPVWAAMLSWDGTTVERGDFVQLDLDGGYHNNVITTTDGAYLVLEHWLSVDRIAVYPITDAGVGSTFNSASHDVAGVGSIEQLIPLSGSDFVVHAGRWVGEDYVRTLQRYAITDGVPVPQGSAYQSALPIQSSCPIPDTQAVLVADTPDDQSVMNLRVIDATTWTVGDVVTIALSNGEWGDGYRFAGRICLGLVAGSSLLIGYVRQVAAEPAKSEFVIQPVVISGTTITVQGDARVIVADPTDADALHIGYGLVIAGAEGIRQDSTESSIETPPGSTDDDLYELANVQLRGQVVDPLVGSGSQLVQDMVSYDDPTQLWDIASIATLHVDLGVPNLTGKHLATRVLFTPV